MEILTHTYSLFSFALLALLAVALLVSQLITSTERRLIAATALIFAGLFFIARPDAPLALLMMGMLGWATGLGIFIRDGLMWRSGDASAAGPFAILFLLPPAIFGAVLLVGLLFSLLVAPARLALRVLG